MTRDIQNIDDDIAFIKRAIKNKLIEDKDILEALNNKDLDIDEPDSYLDVNIYGYLRVPQTQETARNFICFTVDDIEADRNNEAMKKQYIQFHAICHLDNMKTNYGMDRHDLIAYLIRDDINWTDVFGTQFKLIENKERAVDSDYYCRTLVFEATRTNSLYKATMSNKYDNIKRR